MNIEDLLKAALCESGLDDLMDTGPSLLVNDLGFNQFLEVNTNFSQSNVSGQSNVNSVPVFIKNAASQSSMQPFMLPSTTCNFAAQSVSFSQSAVGIVRNTNPIQLTGIRPQSPVMNLVPRPSPHRIGVQRLQNVTAVNSVSQPPRQQIVLQQTQSRQLTTVFMQITKPNMKAN